MVSGVYRVAALQAGAVGAAAALLGLMAGSGAARSLLLGGFAYWLPNLWFAWRTRQAAAARRAGAVGLLVAEAVKLIAVTVLLYGLPHAFEVSWPALLAGLFVVMFVNLVALLLEL